MFGKYVVDQNGRIFTAKFIEAEPYPWLASSFSEIRALLFEVLFSTKMVDLRGLEPLTSAM